MKPTLVFDYDGTLQETDIIYGPAVRAASKHDVVIADVVKPHAREAVDVKQPVDHIRRLQSLSQKTNGESNHEQQHPSRTEIRCQP